MPKSKRAKPKFREGDRVRVRGFNNRAYIQHIIDKRQGSVMLDRKIDGFSMWNVDALVHVGPRKRKSNA
jgi:hypothetical protein